VIRSSGPIRPKAKWKSIPRHFNRGIDEIFTQKKRSGLTPFLLRRSFRRTIPASRHQSSRQRHPVRKLTSRWTVVAPQRLRAVTFFPLGVRMVCQWRLSRDTLTHTHAWWNYRRRSMTMKILVGPLLNFLQCLLLGIRPAKISPLDQSRLRPSGLQSLGGKATLV
jgi:hypothetical protein